MAVTLTHRRYSFRSVHSLTTGERKEQRHGHQYYLEVGFNNCPVQQIDQVVETQILNLLDRREINRVLPVSTGEVLVEWVHQRLLDSPIGNCVAVVAVQETRKNRFVSAKTDARWL